MARYAPGSQTRPVMAEKAEIARQLLGRGLTIQQIQMQLRCSASFVRHVREDRQTSEYDGKRSTPGEATRR